MDNYQVFWNSQISTQGHLQLVIDWDVFIHNFAASIATYAHYQLNAIQREFIRAKIDPQRKGQVCKAAFLLFAQDYWDIPSNRTNLFKMRMNLSQVLPRLTLLTRSTPQRLTLTITYQSEGKVIYNRYEYREDVLYEIDEKGYEKDERKLNEKGFITVGSANHCDIVIQDSLFVNKSHVKIASTRKVIKNPKKRSYYEQKEEDNLEVVEWYVRDTARSNRMRYVLDIPHKFVFLKPGMVISLGLTGDLQVQIKQIDNSTSEVVVPIVQQSQIESLLNADRINFMGQVDPNIPLKTTLEMDFKELSAREIEDMVKDKQYYAVRETGPTKKNEKKEAPSLSFAIFNKRTFESTLINALEPSFTIGRSKTCKYRLNDIGVRDQQLLFRCLNGFWTVSSPNIMGIPSFQINTPAIFLAPLRNLQQGKVSNRVQIRQGYPYRLRGKQFEFSVQLAEAAQHKE